MLCHLAIRDIVLIDRLEVPFGPGLTILTGETGAGKSILLDSLALALGGRAERGLVRSGCKQGGVTATFALPDDHPVFGLLDEQSVEPGEDLILRRVVTADGRSRAYVNDQPVGAGLLRRIGQHLVEIHGQHDAHGLLDTATHRALLDAYGGNQALQREVAAAHTAWQQQRERLRAMAEQMHEAQREELWLKRVHDDLAELRPVAGEEQELIDARGRIAGREKLRTAYDEALAGIYGDQGVQDGLNRTERMLERVLPLHEEMIQPVLAALNRARIELDEAIGGLHQAETALDGSADELQRIDDRLYALRAAARRYRTDCDSLAGLFDDAAARLHTLEQGGDGLVQQEAELARARARFEDAARHLSTARAEAAAALSARVQKELAPLKLAKARFHVQLSALNPENWAGHGAENVAFHLAANLGQAPAALNKCASGGELSRILLALKVALNACSGAPAMVFDEIDAGLGGATADAVGERLAGLARQQQVLVVTHAPQVAARADAHFLIEKRVLRAATTVRMTSLNRDKRREEIARMLAGQAITEAARAAADDLLALAA